MKVLRALVLVVLVAVVAFVAYRLANRHHDDGATVAVYYCKTDGQTLVPWHVSLGPARDAQSVAFYAATQAVAGPAADVEAIRFPSGTIVRRVDVSGAAVTVDLGGNVANSEGGSFAENGEFKALVWTMTSLPGISSVRIAVDGARVPTLPGGHIELDEPLTRSDF